MFLGYCDLDLASILVNGVRSVSPIYFEVGIPNLVCGYTLGSTSVTYCFVVTVTLTSGLSSKKICLEHISYFI